MATYTFSIIATDNNGCTGERNYSIDVCDQITFNGGALPDAYQNQAYSAQIDVDGGATDYASIVVTGMPDGMGAAANLATGVVVFSGTVTETGDFTINIAVTDAEGCTASQDYEITVHADTQGLHLYNGEASFWADGGQWYVPVINGDTVTGWTYEFWMYMENATDYQDSNSLHSGWRIVDITTGDSGYHRGGSSFGQSNGNHAWSYWTPNTWGAQTGRGRDPWDATLAWSVDAVLNANAYVLKNVWHHLAVSWDGTTVRAYLNGNKALTDYNVDYTAPAEMTYTNIGFVLGNKPEWTLSDNNTYPGLYGNDPTVGGGAYRNRTSFTTRQIRLSSVGRYTGASFTPQRTFQPDSNTIALWPCNENTGNILYDISGNNHHLEASTSKFSSFPNIGSISAGHTWTVVHKT